MTHESAWVRDGVDGLGIGVLCVFFLVFLVCVLDSPRFGPGFSWEILSGNFSLWAVIGFTRDARAGFEWLRLSPWDAKGRGLRIVRTFRIGIVVLGGLGLGIGRF